MLRKLSIPVVRVCVCVAFVLQLRHRHKQQVPVQRENFCCHRAKVNSVICLLYAATLPSYDCIYICVCVCLCVYRGIGNAWTNFGVAAPRL